MKQPVEVRLLEALIPPPDYELVCLVGTTYSLNPTVFLAIVSAASFDWVGRGGSIDFDSLTKEEKRSLILEKRRNCLLFVDHHGAFETGAGGLKPLELVSLDQVIKKRGRDTQDGGSLHSKLLVAFYKNSKGDIVGRVFVGSKNFTTSQMREFGAVYDLRRTSKSVVNRSFTNSLVKYLEYLRSEEASGTENAKLRPIDQALELLREGMLSLNDTTAAFHWQGRYKDRKFGKSLAEQLQHLLGTKWDGIFVHSPWTRQAAVRHFADPMPDVPIRVACLKEPGLSTLKRSNIHYDLSYSPSGHVPTHQSHAKVYLFSRRKESVLVFGSANLTPDEWGLPVQGCRPNAEILVSTKVNAADFRYLAEIGGKMEDFKPTKTEPSLQEQVLSLLNSIQVRVSFVRDPAHLKYEIGLSGALEGFNEKVLIGHELIENLEGEAGNELPICSSWPLPPRVDVPWARGDLARVSSLVRIACPAHSVETHLIVELDSEFYEGREKLKVMQYKAKEIVESLALLMDVVVPQTAPPPDGSGSGHQEQLAALLDGLRAERYAYKMSRLKTREPSTYLRTIDRVAKLLSAAKSDETLGIDARFGKLIQAVECVHGELARA